MEIKISQMFRYPVLGCAGEAIQTAEINCFGIQGDHAYAIVSRKLENNKVVCQEHFNQDLLGIAKLALIRPRIYQKDIPRMDLLELSAPHIHPCTIRAEPESRKEILIYRGKECTTGYDMGNEIAEWLTAVLSPEIRGEYRLIKIGWSHSKKSASGQARIPFGKQGQISLISSSSIDHLNQMVRQGQEVSPIQFRPNLILGSNCLRPFTEDCLASLDINSGIYGQIILHDAGSIIRSMEIQINQDTGEVISPDPYLTLSKMTKPTSFGRWVECWTATTYTLQAGSDTRIYKHETQSA